MQAYFAGSKKDEQEARHQSVGYFGGVRIYADNPLHISANMRQP
jgi:hypothetical protein